MNVIEGFWLSFLQIVVTLLRLYTYVIIARALVSWVNPDPYNPIVRALNAMTEPALRPLRRLVPPRKTGGIDLSPLLAILILWFVMNGLVYSFRIRPSRMLF